MESSISHIAGPAKLPDRLFRILADTTSVGISVYARDRVLYVNPAMEVITGYSAGELLAMSPLDPVHPDDRAEVERTLEARLRGERPEGERFEVRFLGPQGDERYIEITASRIEWRGRPASVATVVDLTERRRAEMELREERERFDLAQSAARYVTWEWNLETDELMVDERAEEIFGVTSEEMGGTGREFLRIIHPEDREQLRNVLRAARDESGADKVATEVRFLLPDGRTGWIGERARLLPAGDGRPRRILGVATDITERKEAELALAEEKERALVTLASIGDGVIRTDREGRIDYMNPVAERLTGWPLEEALGRPLMEVYRIVDESSRKPLANPLDACLGQRRVVELPGNTLLLHREGRDFTIQDSAAPILTRDGRLTGAVLVFKDVTLVRGMEREVSYLATHDPLTGLVNRHEFERRVERLLDLPGGEARAALCYLDLDEFKLINDTCGHLAGDELLQQLAEDLQQRVAPGDTVARLGGDEFGVLFEGVSPEEARERARQVKEAVARFRFEWDDRLFTLGVSVGLVLLHRGGSAAELLSAADAACYLAKEEGRNRIHEHQPDDERLARRYGEMHWIHRIHKAFEEDRFHLFVQRIEPLEGDEPLAEIFIRMEDPEGGIITPGNFIPAAERFHLIPAIDRWVTRNAFRRLAGLGADEHRPGTCFAINVSGQSLGDEAFLKYVVSELEASGVDPSRICFEITETAAVTHLHRAHRFMSVLRGFGCRFILDDFGSGLSSFAYLKNLQVDFLKVSGDFVRGVGGSGVQWALTRSIHELGRLMGMHTIAEGVETEEEVEAVREIGFDYAQGYFFNRPGPL